MAVRQHGGRHREVRAHGDAHVPARPRPGDADLDGISHQLDASLGLSQGRHAAQHATLEPRLATLYLATLRRHRHAALAPPAIGIAPGCRRGAAVADVTAGGESARKPLSHHGGVGDT
eukprot:scaffold46474_cov69-Phaeocystis_antarctica.AAC.3